MNHGTLYIVATPIGNLADMSQRALTTLSAVDCIAAEDTRHSRKLLQYYQIGTPLLSLHDYNEQHRLTALLQQLIAGQSIALISDAGTPLISDPGYRLVSAAHAAQIPVVPIPGACAAISALSAAGLPSDRFFFMGFLSAKTQQRQQQLAEVKSFEHTLVFYEAPHRIQALLTDMAAVLGKDRMAAIAKELTKQYETIQRGSIVELSDWLAAVPERSKGEFVVLVTGASKKELFIDAHTLDMATTLAKELPLKQAVKLTAEVTKVNKRQLYQAMLTTRT